MKSSLHKLNKFISEECIEDFAMTYQDFAIDCAFSIRAGTFNVMSGEFLQLIKRYFVDLVAKHGKDQVKIAVTHKFIEEAINDRFKILSSVNSDLTLNSDWYIREYLKPNSSYVNYFNASNIKYADKNSFGSMGYFLLIAMINADFKILIKDLATVNFVEFATQLHDTRAIVLKLRRTLNSLGWWTLADHVNIVLVKSVLLNTPLLRYPYDDDGMWKDVYLINEAIFPNLFKLGSRKYMSTLNILLSSPHFPRFDQLSSVNLNKLLLASSFELDILKEHLFADGEFNVLTTKRFNAIANDRHKQHRLAPFGKYSTQHQYVMGERMDCRVGNFYLSYKNLEAMALGVTGKLLNGNNSDSINLDNLDDEVLDTFNTSYEAYHKFFEDILTSGTELNKTYSKREILRRVKELNVVEDYMDKGLSFIPTELVLQSMFFTTKREDIMFDKETWLSMISNYNEQLTNTLDTLFMDAIDEIFTRSCSTKIIHFKGLFEALSGGFATKSADILLGCALLNDKAMCVENKHLSETLIPLFSASQQATISLRDDDIDLDCSLSSMYKVFLPATSEIFFPKDIDPENNHLVQSVYRSLAQRLYINAIIGVFKLTSRKIKVTPYMVSDELSWLMRGITVTLDRAVKYRSKKKVENDPKVIEFLDNLSSMFLNLTEFYDFDEIVKHSEDAIQRIKPAPQEFRTEEDECETDWNPIESICNVIETSSFKTSLNTDDDIGNDVKDALLMTRRILTETGNYILKAKDIIINLKKEEVK